MPLMKIQMLYLSLYMYSCNHLIVSGAAAATSSTLLVDSVLRMKTLPAAPAAIQKCKN